MNELAFPSMGTHVRLLASDAARLPAARAEVERLAAALTRFDPASELCALNADPRRVVPASADLCAAVGAALDGARLTGGLADPTLLGALERAGYRDSLTGAHADRRGAAGRARARARPAAATAGAPSASTTARSSARRASAWTSAAAPRASSPTASPPCSAASARWTAAATCACAAPTLCSCAIR